MNTIERLPDGSYSARFPWKDNPPALPINFLTCVCWTISLACNLTKLLICFPSIIKFWHTRSAVVQWIHWMSVSSSWPHNGPLHSISCCQERLLDHSDLYCLWLQLPSLKRPTKFEQLLLSSDPQLNHLCCITLWFKCHPIGICSNIPPYLATWGWQTTDQISMAD